MKSIRFAPASWVFQRERSVVFCRAIKYLSFIEREALALVWTLTLLHCCGVALSADSITPLSIWRLLANAAPESNAEKVVLDPVSRATADAN